MKLKDLIKDLEKLGVDEDSDINVDLTMRKSGGVKDIHIVVLKQKHTKSKLALH